MIPNYQSVVAELAAQYPIEWRAAHTGGPQTEAFIRRLAWVLHQRDPKCGLNGKRGNEHDLSDDVICYRSPGQSIDVRTGERVSVIDVIARAGSPEAAPWWGEVWDPNQIPTRATWVQPEPVGDVPVPTPTPTPTPTPECRYQPIDLGPLANTLAVLAVQVAGAREDLDTVVAQVAALRAEVQDVRAALVNGLAIEGTGTGLRWVGTQTITGVAKG